MIVCVKIIEIGKKKVQLQKTFCYKMHLYFEVFMNMTIIFYYPRRLIPHFMTFFYLKDKDHSNSFILTKTTDKIIFCILSAGGLSYQIDNNYSSFLFMYQSLTFFATKQKLDFKIMFLNVCYIFP